MMVVIVLNSLSLGLSLGLSGPTGGEFTPENAAGLSNCPSLQQFS